MNINYWDCKFEECDDYYDEDEGQVWMYACSHPKNKDKYCYLDNKWGSGKDNCILLDNDEQPTE